MQYITEPTKNYSNLETLREDLAIRDVRETKSFPLQEMNLTKDGVLQVNGIGEFLLSDLALLDAVRRGGLQVPTFQNFFEEHKSVLDEAVVNAINSFYHHSRYAGSEVKLITRANGNDRVVLGIPSKSYCLLTNERALEKISKTLSSNLKLTRANLYPEFLQLAFTDTINEARDKVGEVVSVGLSFLNSEGSRKSSLVVSSFSLRLVCLNGATAAEKMFTARYIHRGDMENNSKFSEDTRNIFNRFSLMMRNLPKLGDIPVTEKLISRIRPTLIETIKTKETDEFIKGIDTSKETVMDLWNRITNLPHRIQNPQSKLKLEQLGFKLLTMHLCYN